MANPKPTLLARAIEYAAKAMLLTIGVLSSAVTWFLLMLVGGGGLLTCGVHVLAGYGWALIVGGVLCICTAVFIRRGLTDA